MARLASIQKAGFYPIPPVVTSHIRRLVSAPYGGRILDPCAGEGDALIQLATELKLEPYAAELHTIRGGLTKQKLEIFIDDVELRNSLPFKDKGLNRALIESFENIKLRKDAIQFLYLNPPYDNGPDGDRLEYQFLKRSTFWLQPSGLLAFVIPQHILNTKEISNYLASWYSNIKVFPFPETEYAQFKQIVLFGTKMHKHEPVNPEKKKYLEDIGQAQESIFFEFQDTATASQNIYPYILPKVLYPTIKYQGLWLSEEIQAREHYAYGNIFSLEYTDLFRGTELVNKRPLMPFKMGHTAYLITAGLINNVILESKELSQKIMIKGQVVKELLRSEEHHEGANGATRTIIINKERPLPEINTLNLETGEIVKVPPAELPQFLMTWLPELTKAIQNDFSPVYTFNLGKYKSRIGNRATLMAAQKHIVAAAATRFEKHDDCIIVGEMGTGKTRMGAVLIAACKYKRVIIVVPSHLVPKWIRETELSLPEANVIQIDTIGQVDKWFALDENKQIQIAILKYTSARAASGWHHTLPSPGLFNEEEASAIRNYKKHIQHNIEQPNNPVMAPNLSQRLLALVPYFSKWASKKARMGLPDSHMGKRLKDKKGNLLTAHIVNQSSTQFAHKVKGNHWELSKSRTRYVPYYQYKRFQESDVTYKGVLHLWQDRKNYPDQYKTPSNLEPPSNGRWRIADYIKKKYKNKVDLVIFDEAHMAKGEDTDQGYAMGRLSTAAKKTLLMTGTIYGGRASTIFYLLYRISKDIREAFTDTSATGRRRILANQWVELYGMWEHRTTTSEGGTGQNSGNTRVNENKREAPGSSPAMLPWILERTAFISLRDLGLELPDYTEIPVKVVPTIEQAASLKQFDSELSAEMRQRLARGDRSLLGAYLQSNLCWPDSPWRDEIVIDPKTRNTPFPHEIARMDALPPGLYPKEIAIIENIKENVFSEQRKVLLLCQQTRNRDITKEWMKKLTDAGLKPITLNAPPAKREAWIDTQLKSGINVLIAHPKAVEVGLDLLEFPTIIWMGTEYSVYTIMQASRRSYRIGQSRDVRIYYYYYESTLQEAAVLLIAQKTAAAIRVNGDVIADDSLAAEDSGSIEDALAKMVLENESTHGDMVEEFFAQAAKDQVVLGGFIGGYEIIDDDPEEIVVTKNHDKPINSFTIGEIVDASPNINIVTITPDDAKEMVGVDLEIPESKPKKQIKLYFGMKMQDSKKKKNSKKQLGSQLGLFDWLED